MRIGFLYEVIRRDERLLLDELAGFPGIETEMICERVTCCVESFSISIGISVPSVLSVSVTLVEVSTRA